MTAHYSIEFHSYWHCGSGLSAGADVDSLPVKDKTTEFRIVLKRVEQLFRRVQQILAESLKRHIPLPIPVGSMDVKNLQVHFFTNMTQP